MHPEGWTFYLWDDGRIPYVIASDFFDPSLITDFIAYLEEINLPINLVPKTSTDHDYIVFVNVPEQFQTDCPTWPLRQIFV